MTELHREDFDAFVREVTGFSPFPWQRRLLAHVLDHGWPRLLDLPTGTGKTTALLIALFALALEPARFHRRIALVVDRRIIVDQVDEYARRIEAALHDDERPTCRAVALRLRSLCTRADASPVRVVHLRGGIPRDDAWLGTPDQPTLIASTVDQVGSRLLFRGYGVSESMRPVHAGVLARDTLFLLDEVHLATAFEETLSVLQGTYASWAERGGTGRPLAVVRMSATPRAGAVEAFGLDDDDRRHPVLAARLSASRRAQLEVIKTKRATDADGCDDNNQRIAEGARDRAVRAIDEGARVVGVVLNRVDTARRAAAALRGRGDLDVLLLTGRMRGVEKAVVQVEVARRAGAGVEHASDARPLVVVATSCIEAGADLDFDALVTEAASLDALRQRFGRLDRLGRHARTWAWILARQDQLGDRADSDDPVYGAALRHTWRYLERHATDGVIDFGLQALPLPAIDELRDLLPPSPEAPVLFPAYLDMWSETRPAPHPDPDPALWLHGKGQPAPSDVSVVFRADLPAVALDDADTLARAREVIEPLPPLADEAVEVRIGEVMRWLDRERPVWRWTAQGLEAILVGELVPGDTIVVDAKAGGLTDGTWDPRSTTAAGDLAERVAFERRGVAVLRLHRDTLPESLAVGLPPDPGTEDPEEADRVREQCEAWLEALPARVDEQPEDWRPLLRAVADAGARRSLTVAPGPDEGLRWRVIVTRPASAIEPTTEDDVSVFAGIEVTLAEHLADVEAWAAAFARTAGVDRPIAEDLALAALLHDIGKADPRFQAMLRGGDPIAAAGGSMLAKSRQFGSVSARRRAQQRSGWPEGLRHELVSLALLDASEPLQSRAHDLDLVRHLVASHHGWCRPWIPAVHDPEPTRVRVTVADVETEVRTDAIDDSFAAECASRFHRLCRRYGWHGLAYLEALLRLGDHRASAAVGSRPVSSP